MEACIVICRMNKKPNRRGQILLINAVNEVTRKNAHSWLEDSHIKKISSVYENYCDVEGFAKVITIADAEKNGWSLSIPLYVREVICEKTVDTRSVSECAAAWLDSAFDKRTTYDDLKKLLEVGQDE
jgi:type I restriction enzyme M protein